MKWRCFAAAVATAVASASGSATATATATAAAIAVAMNDPLQVMHKEMIRVGMVLIDPLQVMHKEMMRRCLGSSWRKKIWLEKVIHQSDQSVRQSIQFNSIQFNQVINQSSRRSGSSR